LVVSLLVAGLGEGVFATGDTGVGGAGVAGAFVGSGTFVGGGASVGFGGLVAVGGGALVGTGDICTTGVGTVGGGCSVSYSASAPPTITQQQHRINNVATITTTTMSRGDRLRVGSFPMTSAGSEDISTAGWGSEVPHSAQNAAPGSLGSPQLGQFMISSSYGKA
jgi:hypothetical protein